MIDDQLKNSRLEMDIPVGAEILELNCGSNKHDEDKHLYLITYVPGQSGAHAYDDKCHRET